MHSTSISPVRKDTPFSTANSKPAAFFVFGTLVLFTLAALLFVLHFGVDIPYFDEWDAIVPRLSGALPITGNWLWSQHNDHRLVVPRLLEIGLLRASGYEYRIPMVLNVLLFAFSATLLIFLAARLRGRPRFTDAVFPILLLHFANYENFIWAVQLQVSITEACIVTLLYIVFTVSVDKTLSLGRAVVSSLCLLLPPLCGAYGLAFTVALSIWLCLYSIHARRSPLSRVAGTVGLIGSISGLALVGLYLIGYHRSSATAGTSAGFSPIAFVRVLIEYMMTAMGRGAALSGVKLTLAEGYDAPYHVSLLMVMCGLAVAAAYAFIFFSAKDARPRRLLATGICLSAVLALFWSLSRRLLIPPATALIIFPALITPVFIVITAFLIIKWWRDHPSEHNTMAGPLVFVAALAGLMISVGIGRSGFGPGAALAGRYTAHSCLILVCAYLFAEKYGSLNQRKFIPIALFAAAVAFLPINTEEGVLRAGVWHQGLQNFYNAADSGASVFALADMGAPAAHYRGAAVVHPVAETLGRGIKQMRSAAIRPFEHVRDNPQTHLISIPMESVQNTADGGMTWILPKSLPVFEVAISYETQTSPTTNLLVSESGSAGIGYVAEVIEVIEDASHLLPQDSQLHTNLPSALLPASGTVQLYPNRIIHGVRIISDLRTVSNKVIQIPPRVRSVILRVMSPLGNNLSKRD